ncbi:putative RNA polymerase II subunit B1 CTD phosphatase rpap2 isoform X2 [Scyliorhinus canicula]|uniref:putative RNA polymerase II subunit B1 CTD phosphatase rpap2 isoform X2 n=1 Tax=Scyliorhinus canicula TaxID=7830 RepID=UPI0018F58EDC|nr:putative RNA polymerase II subunit B1 CTD phosphatase rpap2 isoform X2 [Scyliorhinus canicula]
MAAEPERGARRPQGRRRRREGASVTVCPPTASGKNRAADSARALERKAALQVALRKNRECETKALHIVEQLLEINVTEEFLLDCVKFITPVHYQDIVEERSIIKHCGYPICQNKLENVPKQQYKISTSTNRVYDITERKCFCSNSCYKASKYLEAQIPKNPLWSREQERSSTCRLLKEQRGSAGEEVRFQSSSFQVSDVDNLPFMEGQHASTSPSNESNSSDSDQEFVSTILFGEKCNLKTTKQKLSKKQQRDLATKPKKMVPASKHLEMDYEVENTAQQLKKYHGNISEISSPRLSQSVETEQLTLVLEEKCSVTSEKNLSPVTTLTEIKDNEKIVADKSFTTRGLSKKGAAALKMLIEKTKQSGHSNSGRCVSAAELSDVRSNALDLLRQTLSEWNTEETLRFLYGSNLKCTKIPTNWPSRTSCTTEQEELDEDDLDNLEVVEITNSNENAGNNENVLPKGVQVGRTEATARPLPNFEEIKQESDFLHLKVREFYKGQYVLPEDTESNCDENSRSMNYVPGNEEENPVLPLLDFAAQHQIRKGIVLDRLNKVLPELLGPLHLGMSDISSELSSLVKTFRLTVKISLLQESVQRLTSELFISTIMKEVNIQSEDLENLTNIFKCPDNN